MAGRQAKILSEATIRRALTLLSKSANAPRDRTIVLLSARAGLRACEIAGLRWSMVLDANGRLGQTLNIRDSIAKRGSGRRVPLHPELRGSLRLLLQRTQTLEGPVIVSQRGGPMRANSVVNWFVELYARLGVSGCSSHSGRRTFITQAARRAHHSGASLRDVQILAGHASIETTQRYIEGDTDAQRRLVRNLTKKGH